MVNEEDQELAYDPIFVDGLETMIDDTLAPKDLLIFSGPEAGVGTNHATSGRDPGRSAPQYLYAPTISPVPNAPGAPTNASDSLAQVYPPNYALGTSRIAYPWQPTSGSGSGSGSSSIISRDSLFASPLLVQQEYFQAQIQTRFGGAAQPLASPTSSQVPFDLLSQPQWGVGLALDDIDDGGGQIGSGPSPVGGVSHSGSYDDGSIGSPEAGEISGGSEINFSGTTGLANYASASPSTIPVSPVSSRQSQENKRVKRPKTSVAVAAAAREESKGTSASSTSGGVEGAHHGKRELRSASRRSKNTQQRAEETAEKRKSRNSHNLVEKQYRNRLNAQFESLLHALPDSVRSGKSKADDADAERADRSVEAEEKRVSKAEVLDMARRHIKSLEEQRDSLENERDGLRESFERLWRLYADGLARDGRSLEEDDILGHSKSQP